MKKNIGLILIVTILCATFIRLGIWQLNRLDERRADNAILREQLAQSPISLNGLNDPTSLLEMTDRAVEVTGRFDFENQRILKNQINDLGPGIDLVAPFLLDSVSGIDGEETAVLVNRGWLHIAEIDNVGAYDKEMTVIVGRIAPSDKATGEPATDTQLFRIAIDDLAPTLPYDLLPIVIVQEPVGEETADSRPYRPPFQPDLSEGSHMGYAVQWFAFALIFGVGTVVYISQSASNRS